MSQPIRWQNWAGNQSFVCRDIARAASVADVVRAVEAESRLPDGQIRAMGSGHSFTPVVQTSGTLLDLSALSGITAIDADRQRVRVRAGTTLGAIGGPLWDAGLALANQGDIDRQTLAGAVSTGTKGSGTGFGTMSSTITGVELVTGSGEVVRIDDTDPRLPAAQVSLGLLGVLTEIELAVVPRYFLRESNLVMHVDELLERWDELKAAYRHFSFWWMPTERSAKVYELPEVPADHAFVKLLQEEPAEDAVTVTGEDGSRLGRAHLVYPDIELGDVFYELEYVVAADRDKEAFLAVRELMQQGHPDQASPVQVRWQQADQGLLSPQYQRDAVSVSVSGIPGTEWEPFLRDVDARLAEMQARPHWGKVHFLTPEQARAVYPGLDAFNVTRRELDPHGLFLNDSLSSIVAQTTAP